VFLKNVQDRIPQFLTETLVRITKNLLIQKDHFKDHPIWNTLELELFKRRNNLNNEQLANVLHSFGVTGNGRQAFFDEMEEVVTDSPVHIETEHLTKILKGYSEVDRGSPVFYSMIVEKLIGRGLAELGPEKAA
jgi:hypothetical protein